MHIKKKNYASLTVWISSLLLVGWILGLLTKKNVTIWYKTLHRSPLTPPDFMFGIAWTFLYICLAIVGWILWNWPDQQNLKRIRQTFALQLILNWSWSPLFFTYHLIGISLICLLTILALACYVMGASYQKVPFVTVLFAPYIAWLLFAAHLHFYIWYFN